VDSSKEKPTPNLVTTSVAAEINSVCNATVRVWAKAGILTPVPMLGGRGVRYRMDDVLAVADKLQARAAK
jgi:predicted site-specific integrase-resolvase